MMLELGDTNFNPRCDSNQIFFLEDKPGQFGFKPLNCQPGSKNSQNIPICPYYQLIKIAGAFCNISSNEISMVRQYCGQKQSLSVLENGVKGFEPRPYSICAQIHGRLKQNLVFELLRVLNINREYTLRAWRQVIFDNSRKDNPIIDLSRRIKSPCDISEEEVLEKVTAIMVNLRDQITGDTEQGKYYIKGAEHCEQAPVFKGYGWISDRTHLWVANPFFSKEE